ncbi:MAG: hypothetical protein ACFCUQ_02030 [Kiloniellales bacterium]
MLFKRHFLEGLADGRITLAFRRWKRPTVRPGGQLRTAVGVLAITAVDAIGPSDISEADARQAGYESRDVLLKELDRRAEAQLYRIALHYAGADPRSRLREADDLTEDDYVAIRKRLARLDSASRHGAWTTNALRLIAERPATRAGDLAATLGRERLPFKRDVRKLKELGLTESLEVGYRLSPRGRALLARIEGEKR